MNKADLENKLQLVANGLTRAHTHFHFAEKLHANRKQLGLANEFWNYTVTAHSSIAFLYLCRAYDFRTDGMNIFNCLKSMNEKALDQGNRNLLSGYVALCGRNSQDRLVASLRTWRNNIVAHYNIDAALDPLKFDQDNPVEPDEILCNLIDRGFIILEWCSSLQGSGTIYQRFAPGTDSCEKVLAALCICESNLAYEPV